MVFNVALCGIYYLFPMSIMSTAMGICGVIASLNEVFVPIVNNSDSKIILSIVMVLAELVTYKIVDEVRSSNF